MVDPAHGRQRAVMEREARLGDGDQCASRASVADIGLGGAEYRGAPAVEPGTECVGFDAILGRVTAAVGLDEAHRRGVDLGVVIGIRQRAAVGVFGGHD